jgi:hypothetical protein
LLGFFHSLRIVAKSGNVGSELLDSAFRRLQARLVIDVYDIRMHNVDIYVFLCVNSRRALGPMIASFPRRLTIELELFDRVNLAELLDHLKLS